MKAEAQTSSRRRWPWPTRSSLRLRYAVVATALAGVGFVAGGAIALSLYRDSLDSEVTQTIRTAAQQVADSARTSRLPDPIPMPVAASVPRIQILDRAGQIVTGDPASVTGPPLSYLAQAEPGHVFVLSDPAHLPDRRAAAITLHVTGPSGPLTIIAVGSLDQADSKVHHALTLSGVLAAISLAVVGAAAWCSTGRTLRRVEKIRTGVAAVAASRDLTQRVPDTRTDELGRLADTLNRMLATIGDSSERQRRFVGDAAHELRTPLAGIATTLEIASRHPQAMDEQWIEQVLAAHRRLAGLVNDLLELAALDGGGDRPRTSVDLAGVVTDAVRRTSTTRLQIRADHIEPTAVRGTESHLDRIITNLLDNALRYARTTIEITLRQQDGRAILTVDDDGPGVPPDQRQRIWERFARIDHHRSTAAGGTGLGLAMVKELAQAHDGTVGVTRSPRLAGARFEIRLPTTPATDIAGARPQ